MKKIKTINILGTDYTLVLNESINNDSKLITRNGYTDFSTKRIVISEYSQDDDNSIGNLEMFYNKVIRHEIIHAFLYESGLAENSDWAENEEMVDWFAYQIPKLYELYKSLEINR